MIKVAILGADTDMAGDIVRLLINHPDADVVALYAPDVAGRPASHIHYGLVGESVPDFSDTISLQDADAVFICSDSVQARNLISSGNPDIRIINCIPEVIPDDKAAYGLSEVNRKALVRGATRATVPSSFAAAALIGLYPPASHMLLRPGVKITFHGPVPSVECREGIRSEIERFIAGAQPSFVPPVDIEFASAEDDCLTARCTIESAVDSDEIIKIFEGIYDDHNFTFIHNRPLAAAEVAGTHKCLVRVDSDTPDGTVAIEVIVDPRMRGHAGDAVHAFNLLFGLHELTGLRLKAFSPSYSNL